MTLASLGRGPLFTSDVSASPRSDSNPDTEDIFKLLRMHWVAMVDPLTFCETSRSSMVEAAALEAPRRPRIATRKARELKDSEIVATKYGIQTATEAAAVKQPIAAAAPAMSRTGCKCKQSRCLKLYCDCFKAGAPWRFWTTTFLPRWALPACIVDVKHNGNALLLRAAMFCGAGCCCLLCQNTNENRDVVQRKRQLILTRHPRAFDDKVWLLPRRSRHISIAPTCTAA